MTYKDLHDTLKNTLDKMHVFEIVPTNPKVNFLISCMTACDHESLEELRHAVIRYKEARKGIPAVFGNVVLFIKQHVR